MEALLAGELPDGPGWQFEPKWDGFRCLAHRDGAEITLTSKSGKPLGRYFPEVIEILAAVKEKRFLLDGELIIPLNDALAYPVCGRDRGHIAQITTGATALIAEGSVTRASPGATCASRETQASRGTTP